MQRTKTGLIALQCVQSAKATVDGTERRTVYFDGSCPLCATEIDYYASRDEDEQLKFVDVSAQNTDLGSGLSNCDAMARFHVRMPDGTLLSGARAFVAVWASLPGWKWAARIAQIPGATPMLEMAYRAFLPLRPFLSKLAEYFGARPANARSNTE